MAHLLSRGSSPSTTARTASSERSFMSAAVPVLMVIYFAGYSASTTFDSVIEKTKFNPGRNALDLVVNVCSIAGHREWLRF